MDIKKYLFDSVTPIQRCITHIALRYLTHPFVMGIKGFVIHPPHEGITELCV
jgi:hypothetical protein